MFVNGNKKGNGAQIMEDTERGGDDFVASRFPDDTDGLLYKMQPWFEVDDGTANTLGFANNNWCTLNRYSTASNSAVQFPPRYRNNWLVRAVNGSANDFSAVYSVIDAANTPTNNCEVHMQANSVEPVIDARQNTLVAGGVAVPLANVTTLKQWIRDARTEISRVVGLQDTNNFVVTSPTVIDTSSNLVILSGVAPVIAYKITVNGVAYDVTWSTVKNWTLRLTVQQPTTVLDIRAYDIYGRPLTGMTGLVTVNYSGPNP